MGENHFVRRKLCPGCKSGGGKNILYFCKFVEPPIREYLESFYSSQGLIEFDYLERAEYILNECSDCGMVYQEEIPDDFLMNELYEKWIDPSRVFEQRKKNRTLDQYLNLAQEITMLISHFDEMPGELRFLAYGMGWGDWCRMAMAFGCETYGAELSEARVRHAESQGVKVITWNQIPDHRFNFINTEQVLEHLPEPVETLTYLKKSLKPEGLLKISVPDGGDIKRRLRIMDWKAPKGSRNSLNPVSPLEHINCFNRRSVVRMADMAGLEEVKISIGIQYSTAAYRKPLRGLLRNILLPLYRNVLERGTYIFFRQKTE